jgi:hypothetical protein
MNCRQNVVLLIAAAGIVGGMLPTLANATDANEAIEKEAHSRPHQWIQVMLSKYDGHCRDMGNYTARRFIDTVSPSQDEIYLVSAQKVGNNDYVLAYKYGLAMTAATFVTSERLCEKVIKEHISQ